MFLYLLSYEFFSLTESIRFIRKCMCCFTSTLNLYIFTIQIEVCTLLQKDQKKNIYFTNRLFYVYEAMNVGDILLDYSLKKNKSIAKPSELIIKTGF